MPNETIEFKDGCVLINGTKLEIPTILKDAGIQYRSAYEITKYDKLKNKVYKTRRDEYFILGDNTYHSNDSRFFGPIKREEIGNKVTGK